jgi:integrase
MTTRRSFGAIRQLPSGRWQARYSTASGKHVNAPHTFHAKLHAEAWLADRKREIDAKLWNPHADRAVRTVFAVYSAAWLASRTARGSALRPRTREMYQSILTRFLLPEFGDCALAEITPGQVREWYARTLTDKPTLRAHTYGLLRTIMATALSDELILANPCRIRGAGQTERVRTIVPATVAELAELTAAMPERLRLAVPLASWCALRFGEMVELRRKDIDLDAEVIRVRRAVVRVKGGHIVADPKSQAGIRDVAIPPHLLPMIRDHLAEHVDDRREALLFPSTRGGGAHLSMTALYRSWTKAREQVGRKDLRWHDLRHSGAVLAAATGASLSELMARLGHSTHKAALRYQHAAQGRDREIAALLSKLADNNTPDI